MTSENAVNPSRSRDTLRLLTYNVRRCLGTDNVLSPQRIAEVIAACEPDIVALQELDVNRRRTGGVDQALVIANALEMSAHFHPAIRVMEEQYGDAILTALPSRMVRGGPLPGLAWFRSLEPRGALWASIDIGSVTLQVINTHLGLFAHEQLAQVQALLGEDWVGDGPRREPMVVLGDFNAMPGSRPYGYLAGRFRDSQNLVRPRSRLATYPARAPLLRIDHVFVSESVDVVSVSVPRFPAALVASDHRPLVVDIVIRPA